MTRVALGDSATMRAATRVNAEQAPTRPMRKPTRHENGEGLLSTGKRATHAPAGSAGVLAAARMEEGDGRNTGSPGGGVARANRQPARDGSGRSGWRRGP